MYLFANSDTLSLSLSHTHKSALLNDFVHSVIVNACLCNEMSVICSYQMPFFG